MIILLVISIFRLEAYFKKSMHFNINYIVTVPPYCTCYIDEWHNIAMITKSVTQRRPIVFPVKITMCNHKINHHHSCLNHLTTAKCMRPVCILYNPIKALTKSNTDEAANKMAYNTQALWQKDPFHAQPGRAWNLSCSRIPEYQQLLAFLYLFAWQAQHWSQ